MVHNPNCLLCAEIPCCPEHCCDFDECKCGDCPQCGGPEEGQKTLEAAEEAPPSHSCNWEEAELPPLIKLEIADGLSLIDKDENLSGEQEPSSVVLPSSAEETLSVEPANSSSVLQSSAEASKLNQDVLASTRETMASIERTLASLKVTQDKFKEFDTAWQTVLTSAAEKIGATLENLDELKAIHGEPRTCDMDEAANAIAQSHKVAVLIGAGLSAESGIPTFKDNDETWEVDGQSFNHVEMCRLEVLQSYPLEFWQKHQTMYSQMRNCSPNEGHYAIAEMYESLRRFGRGVCVITQNIDSLDTLVLGPEADLYQVHGCLAQMRCMFECSEELYPAPDDEFLMSIPCCYNCGGPARPNILMFDEDYTEKYYRADSALAASMEADCLIVVGTALGVSWPAKLVKGFAKTGKTIVEINVEPNIEYGNALVFPDRCTAVLPPLADKVISILRS